MIDLEATRDFRVCLIGDGIIDDYYFVKPLGKSIKENALSTLFEKKESFRGGVWAAAEHIREFVAQVDVRTSSNVMVNWKFLEEQPVGKLFTMHEARMDANAGDADFAAYDLVIVTDFGHGAMSKPMIARVVKEARFLAVNAQTNTTNYGFNMITKYPRADFVVIDELEARLAAHDRDSPIEDVILHLVQQSGFKKMIVTMGRNGACGYDGAFERMPAVAEKVVDTVGCGDAFLVVASLYAKAGASMRDLLRIGNAAGGIKAGIVGHRGHVTKEALRGVLHG